jgi:hypothetical protein
MRRLFSFGEMPTTPVLRLMSLFRRSSGFVEEICLQCSSGEAHVGKDLLFALQQEHRAPRHAFFRAIGERSQFFLCHCLVRLLKHQPDGGKHYALAVCGDEREQVAQEAHPAVLPARARKISSMALRSPWWRQR